MSADKKENCGLFGIYGDPEAVEKTLQASSFKGNPIPLNATELTGILEQAL